MVPSCRAIFGFWEMKLNRRCMQGVCKTIKKVNKSVSKEKNGCKKVKIKYSLLGLITIKHKATTSYMDTCCKIQPNPKKRCPHTNNPVKKWHHLSWRIPWTLVAIFNEVLFRGRVFRGCSDPLSFPHDILYERYRFSAEGIRYECRLLESYVGNITKTSHYSNANCVHSIWDFFKQELTCIQLVNACNLSKDCMPCYSPGCTCSHSTNEYV